MKKSMHRLCAVLTALLIIAGYHNIILARNTQQNAEGGETALSDNSQSILPETMLSSYYEGQNDNAFSYFQHKSIQRFLAMWVREATGDIIDPKWNLDSFTRICILNHNFLQSHENDRLYCCTFSDGADRCGYIILEYNDMDPSVSNWGVTETTPYQYDLKANMEEITECLLKADIDIETASASRVYLYDKDNKRADQVIRFTDGKGDNYICYFGTSPIAIEKWQKS